MRKIVALAGASILAVTAGACSLLPGNTAAVGDCINIDTSTEEVTNLKGFSCDDEHDAEVYVKQDVALDGSYDEEAITQAAQELCFNEFQPFVGADYYSSSLDISYFFPSPDSWKSGSREVVCTIYTPDYDTGGIIRTTGSVKDSAK